jgi:ribosomal protein S18 acetylase RimI-like enzyme
MIRHANKGDSKLLAALSIQVWLNTYARDGINLPIANYVLNTFTEGFFKEQLSNKNHPTYLFFDGENLLGFIALQLDSVYQSAVNGYEIDTLYIQDRHQGKGIARLLISHARQRHGQTHWLKTWEHNIEAQRFYQYIGFKHIGTSYFELDGEKHDNHVFAYTPN